MARAGTVVLVAVVAFIGTRFLIDREAFNAPSELSDASSSGNRGAGSTLSPLNTGVETPSTSNASATPIGQTAAMGNADERVKAMNVDRDLVEAGREQIYGTQHQCQNGELVPSTPIRKPDEVDLLRARVGFPPLDESLQNLTEENDPCPDAGS
jgi:hypothetical protein